MVWLAVSVLAGLMAGGSGGPAMAADLADTASDSTYVMVVYGDTRSAGAVFPLPTGTVINCTNIRTGVVVAGVVGATSHGSYEAVFFSTDNYVAAVDDVIQIAVEDMVFNAPNGRRVLTAEDVVLGSARIDILPDGMSAVPTPGPVSGIHRCFPNPFNPRVTIFWALGATGSARLSVYDIRGHQVRVLREGILTAGRHEVIWNGLSDAEMALPSGVYLAVLRSADGVSAQKLVLAR